MESFKVRGIEFDWSINSQYYQSILEHKDFLLIMCVYQTLLTKEFIVNGKLLASNSNDKFDICYKSSSEKESYQTVIEKSLIQLNEALHKRLELAKSSVQQLTSAIIKTL
jgi:hypothetical protein